MDYRCVLSSVVHSRYPTPLPSRELSDGHTAPAVRRAPPPGVRMGTAYKQQAKARRMTFQAGRSGNPAGRKKGTHNKLTIKSREQLWAYIEQQCALGKQANPFIVLVDTMVRSRHASLKIACAGDLADRLLPKLKAVEHTGKDGGPIDYREVPAAERQRLITALLAKRNGHVVAGG